MLYFNHVLKIIEQKTQSRWSEVCILLEKFEKIPVNISINIDTYPWFIYSLSQNWRDGDHNYTLIQLPLLF